MPRTSPPWLRTWPLSPPSCPDWQWELRWTGEGQTQRSWSHGWEVGSGLSVQCSLTQRPGSRVPAPGAAWVTGAISAIAWGMQSPVIPPTSIPSFSHSTNTQSLWWCQELCRLL